MTSFSVAAHAVSRAPHPGEEVERDQHQVEEGHEQGQVLSAEGAEHRGLGQPEMEVEGPGAVPLAQRGPDQRGAEQHRGDQDQGDVQPVGPELVVDPQRADPGGVGEELQPGVPELEPGHERDRNPERDEAAHRHHAPDHTGRHERGDQRDRQRKPDQDRQGHRLMSSRSGSRGTQRTCRPRSRRRSSAGSRSASDAPRPNRRGPRRASRR